MSEILFLYLKNGSFTLTAFLKEKHAREAISFFIIYSQVYLMIAELSLTFIFILCSTQEQQRQQERLQQQQLQAMQSLLTQQQQQSQAMLSLFERFATKTDP